MIHIAEYRKVNQREGHPECPVGVGETAIEKEIREVRFEQRFEKGMRKPQSRHLGEEHPRQRAA